MKKLMIAAAAVAMIGSVFADTAYTFSANVKTTKGKDGKDSYKTVNLGVSVSGAFWYEDQEALDMMQAYPLYWTTKKVGKATIPALTAAAKKDYDFINDLVAGLNDDYSNKSAGKWCESVRCKLYAACYRVSCSQKFSDVVVSDCCGTQGFTGLGCFIDPTYSQDLSTVQLFGAQDYEKANKCEMFAEVVSPVVLTCFIAGQGSIGTVLDNTVGVLTKVSGVSSISGSLVAILNPPECEYCCSAPQAAGAFECGVGIYDTGLNTAAYGTFTLKYNAKETKAL